MVPDPCDIFQILRAALEALRASGPDGFEGLVRDAYREATGISLRLQKAGPQGGADAVSDGDNEIAAGIEAKRYRETTSLPLDELKTKLIDAATRAGNPIELWLLVASREVSGDNVAELRRIGDQHGVGVLVLDWRSEADLLAPLPLLLALAPDAARRFLDDEVVRALDAIAQHPEYEVQKRDLLNRLTRPDLGHAHAARAVAERIEQTLRTRADAKARLQSPVDMGAPSRIWVPRDGHCKVIQEWTGDAARTPVCAILGNEGLGKTWLLFDWWRREVRGAAAPLILWLSAREVTSGSLSDVIGAALSKWITTPKRDSAFWSRRAELWRRTRDTTSPAPCLWLMLDGLNEGTSQQYVLQLLAQAEDSDWKGAIGILLTNRPTDWERDFQSGKKLEVPPKIITVSRFTDGELDEMLAKHGKSRDAFSLQVLEIIKWPSWFAVAAAMFAQEHDWSAHSPEQLMVRYVQHRLQERTQKSILSSDMFRDFISDLGSEMRANWGPGRRFSRAELKERLSGYSGEPEKDVLDAVDDVTAGLWMTPDGAHRFSIENAVLPFAISLALLSQVRAATTEQEADSEVERFLGPIEDQDIGANVLAAAVSLAFIDGGIADHTRKALLKRWLGAHNFAPAHFQMLWRIGSAFPQALFGVAEDVWLQQAGGSSVDELLIKSIANIATDGGGQAAVIEFFTKWASAYWMDPKEGQFISYHPSAQETSGAHAETEQRLSQLQSDLGDNAALGFLHRCENGTGASWLTHRMLSIATYLPRAVQTPVWRGWVLSRAAMGRSRHFDDLSWSLRVNPIDGPAATRALLEAVDDLLTLPSAHVHEAASWLLEAHGGPEAAEKMAAVGKAFTTSRRLLIDDAARIIEGVVTIIDDRERNDRNTTRLLSHFAEDPAARISEAHRAQLERYSSVFPVAEVGDGRGQTGAGIDLDSAVPALAHWAPDAFAELYRRYLSTLRSRDEERLLGQAFSLNRLLILQTDEHQDDIRATLVARIATKEGGKLDQIDYALLHAALFDRTETEQRNLWAQIGAPDQVLTSLEHVIRPISASALRHLQDELHPSRTSKQLISWLAFLECSGTKHFPDDWEALWQLFDHENSTVRYLALELALASKDQSLGQRLLETKWTAAESRGVLENWAGSLLLCSIANPDNFETISNRIDPQWTAVLWQHFDFDPAFSGPFEVFLRASVELELNPPPSRQISQFRCDPVEATRKLLEQKRPFVSELADRLFAARHISVFFRSDWPRLQLLQALFAIDPPHGVRAWRALAAIPGPLKSTSDELDELPFEAKDDPEVDALRVTLLERAANDWALAGIGLFIARHQRAAWAVRQIRQMLAQPSCPGDIARAIMFAGFLDDSGAARELWAQELRSAPLDGWLGVVYREARQNIERVWHALEWLDGMFEAETDEGFFAYFQLFLRLANRQLQPIAARRVRERLSSLSPRRKDYLLLNWDAVADQIKKKKNDREATLFSFRIGYRWALPWGSA